jgi:hypothetical protein
VDEKTKIDECGGLVALVNERAAARFLGLKSPRSLQNWRTKRIGPPFVKIGGCVRYEVSALENYVAAHRVVAE